MQLTTPCDMDWDALAGTGASRHCPACVRQVHDVTDCGADELAALRAREGSFCGRWLRMRNGHVTTRPLLLAAVAAAACAVPPRSEEVAEGLASTGDPADTARLDETAGDTGDTELSPRARAIALRALRVLTVAGPFPADPPAARAPARSGAGTTPHEDGAAAHPAPPPLHAPPGTRAANLVNDEAVRAARHATDWILRATRDAAALVSPRPVVFGGF